MKQVVDLTGKNFDRIDFSEAKIIDLYCQYILPNSLEFTLWGATILLSSHWKHDKKFLNGVNYDDDVYVSGIGVLKIDNLISGSIEIYPYDNKKDELNRIVFAKSIDGSDLVFRRHWDSQNKDSDATEYRWGCVIKWPYGYCILSLLSKGSVKFEFDSEDMIPVEDYVRNPHRYSFSRKIN